jgi:ribosome maturation factor RimP
MYRDIPEALRALVEPIVADHGFELVVADVSRGPAGSLVRVVIDTALGDGRVPIDDCAAVSREIGTGLDASELVRQPYTLEVSSPGLDRILGREKDFAAACGREIKLETRQPIDGRRRFRGELVAFDAGRVRLLVDGKPVEIAFADVARANQVYHFTNADFAKKSAAERPASGAPSHSAREARR